ncbi:MAG: hypothetical protein CVV24_01135 [Ignavibacteriae bacterium HGW-Ignavibacteriae-3]|nr:MAG: hypothetical protein CVV24_01135 [Ignavibacteriae bacterium HGW-Ignavibacteriae-3]
MKNIYKEDDGKYAGMIEDLKNLPKVETPENFEYNLMTRIQNKNFGDSKIKDPAFNWIKFLTPSAVVVTAVILLFIFIPSNQQTDNQFSKFDNKIVNNSIADNKNDASGDIINQGKPPISNGAKSLAETSKSSANTDNSVKNVNPRIPFGYSRSVSLDDYITGSNHQNNLQRGNVVNSGNSETPFDGFFLVEKPDPNLLMKERARIDSVKNAKAKADSLKKVQK